ncbi:MAG: DMT family transporter [Clostridia bacterium]|nr:DMT family transporter [Clostridia bacterium]
MKVFIRNNFAVLLALLAALLFGLNAPLSKMLLISFPPMYMVSMLYLGAGFGMLFLYIFKKNKNKEANLSKSDAKWAVLMIVLDIVAPFFLMLGLKLSSSASASLLFNFEMVATTLVALIFFKESIGKRLWLAIGLITFASLLLTFDFSENLLISFSLGSLFVLIACVTWGFENNFTRNMSHKDPSQIVILKGFGSGTGALIVFFLTEYKSFTFSLSSTVYALVLGFVSYGLSIFFYVKAQRFLGASRTSAFYAAAPFLGVIFSFILFRETLSIAFSVSFFIMLAGAYLAASEKHEHLHHHELMTHTHKHSHDDLHHLHSQENLTHSHTHTHQEMDHTHVHKPDIHHRHK